MSGEALVKYFFSISKPHTIDPSDLAPILPPNIIYSEENTATLILETDSDISDDAARYQVLRECDRLDFLTGEKLSPMLTRKEQNGITEAYSGIKFEASPVKRLDPAVQRQQWDQSPALAAQLLFWRLAHEPRLDATSKIRLLFLIIENADPGKSAYPKYHDSSSQPNPKTESKLLRNLVSHQGNKMREQLEHYCRFLGRRPDKSFDPTDSGDWVIISQRLHVVEEVAGKIIEQAITKRYQLTSG